MENQIISLIFMTLSGTAQGMGMEFMMKEKKNRSIFLRIFHWTIFAFVASIINIFISAGKDTVVLRMSLHWIGAFSAIIFYYSDPLWRRVLAIFLLFFSTGVAELTTASVLTFTSINMEILYNRTHSATAATIAWGTVVSCIFILILVALWKRFFYKGRSMKYIGVILLSAVNNCITCYFFVEAIWEDNMLFYKHFPFVVGTICQIALLVLVFSQVEKEQLENNLMEVKRKNELEQSYYEDIKRRREESAALVRKNDEDIRMIKELMEDELFGKAELVLKELLKRMDKTRGYTYCEIPIINAVLSEKQKECEECDIKLAANINISDSSKIQQLDLCSVFGNLMDNAIRACKQVNLGNCTGENAEITLTAAAKGSYLIIKCDNPTMNEPGKKPEGTGYGLKIIKDIAVRYHGDLRIQHQNQRFEAIVALRNS